MANSKIQDSMRCCSDPWLEIQAFEVIAKSWGRAEVGEGRKGKGARGEGGKGGAEGESRGRGRRTRGGVLPYIWAMQGCATQQSMGLQINILVWDRAVHTFCLEQGG